MGFVSRTVKLSFNQQGLSNYGIRHDSAEQHGNVMWLLVLCDHGSLSISNCVLYIHCVISGKYSIHLVATATHIYPHCVPCHEHCEYVANIGLL